MKTKHFFAVVTKNCKTVFVEKNKRTVREKITRRHVTGNNFAMFECCFNGKRVNKVLMHKPAFKLMPRHHRVLENACLDFLKNEMRA